MKRQIEVFTAGCPVCESTVKRVRELTCKDCEVTIYDLVKQCEDKACLAKLKAYNIINQQHALLNEVFKQGLTFREDTFRTPAINPAFSHDLLRMKEKRLLLVEQPLSPHQEFPFGSGNGIRTRV
ncbi:MAG TPA: hypothetical protein VFX43_05680 [Chitinophagaceae bacterium]|nr:hypothetical protein [Chitinophagaceae bacterium]